MDHTDELAAQILVALIGRGETLPDPDKDPEDVDTVIAFAFDYATAFERHRLERCGVVRE